MLEKYQNELDVFNKNDFKNVRFINSAIEKFNLEISKTRFDYIFCLNVINHVENIDLVLQNLRSLLKDGGKLIISVDAHNFNLLYYYFNMFSIGDILHPHQLRYSDYESLFTSNRFKVIDSIQYKKEFIFSYYIFTLT